jgi:hypothetical protein
MCDFAVSRTKVWNDMRDGTLRYKRVGKRGRLVTPADAIDYIERLPDGQTPTKASEDSAA